MKWKEREKTGKRGGGPEKWKDGTGFLCFREKSAEHSFGSCWMWVSEEEVCGNNGSNLSLDRSDWDCMFLESVYIRCGRLINTPASALV